MAVEYISRKATDKDRKKDKYLSEDSMVIEKKAKVAKKMKGKDFSDYPGGKRQYNKEEKESKQFAPGGRYHK